MPKRDDKMIPTFAADGKRLRSYSLGAVERLLGLSKIVVKRNKQGRITCAQFRAEGGANPLRVTAHAGTKYSFFNRIGNSNSHAWEHKELLPRQDVERLFGQTIESPAELDRCLQAIFRAVPLSVMVSERGRTQAPIG